MNTPNRVDTFKAIAIKKNPDFDIYQFIHHNTVLFDTIMESMDRYCAEYKTEVKRQKKLIDDDTDYKAMREYAISLERKLGINPESGK